MSYDVRLLQKSEDDLDRITGWLVERSPGGAVRWIEALERVIDALERNPESFGFAPENEHVAYEVRQVFFAAPSGGRYRALYTIAGNQVRVLRVRGPGQDVLTQDDL